MGLHPFLYSGPAQGRAFIEPAVVNFTLVLYNKGSAHHHLTILSVQQRHLASIVKQLVGSILDKIMIMIITFAALDFESLSSSLRNSLLGYGIVIPANALESQKSSGYIASMHDNL